MHIHIRASSSYYPVIRLIFALFGHVCVWLGNMNSFLRNLSQLISHIFVDYTSVADLANGKVIGFCVKVKMKISQMKLFPKNASVK